MISKKIEVGLNIDIVFKKFIHEFGHWWPEEYTWSQDALKEISIDPKKDGLCTETGPHGFRCDWGRITEIRQNQIIGMKWQISPNREPVPNPENASDINIEFSSNGGKTTIKLVHQHFKNHGEGAEDYEDMMNSEQGWDYILNCFRTYCQSS